MMFFCTVVKDRVGRLVVDLSLILRLFLVCAILFVIDERRPQFVNEAERERESERKEKKKKRENEMESCCCCSYRLGG